MKKLRDMSNKELEKVNRITLIIAVIFDFGIIIENIIWYDDYSLAVIISGPIAIACAICYIIDQIKRNKRKDKINKKKGK